MAPFLLLELGTLPACGLGSGRDQAGPAFTHSILSGCSQNTLAFVRRSAPRAMLGPTMPGVSRALLQMAWGGWTSGTPWTPPPTSSRSASACGHCSSLTPLPGLPAPHLCGKPYRQCCGPPALPTLDRHHRDAPGPLVDKVAAAHIPAGAMPQSCLGDETCCHARPAWLLASTGCLQGLAR